MNNGKEGMQLLTSNVAELFPRIKNESITIPRNPQCSHCTAEIDLAEFKRDLLEMLIKHFK